jgi:outer membrane lipoprotein-sorting protein
MKIILTLVLTTIFLSGCGIQSLKYKNKELPREQIEEILENELELQNPSLDLDVTIMSE